MAPWPNKPCPHCGNIITDLLTEMVPDAQQIGPEFKALVTGQPGGAITCPYCQAAIEYAANGEDLRVSTGKPLRYSRVKVEERARRFGEIMLEQPNCTPEQWMAQDRQMPGALRGYRYAEDQP